jgi:hypothetical protein
MVAHLSKADKNDADGTAPSSWGTEFMMDAFDDEAGRTKYHDSSCLF